MIPVVPFTNQRRVAVLCEQAEAVPEIPATRSLAEVAAHGADGHQLRAAHTFRRDDQSGEVFLDGFVPGQFAERRHGANADGLALDLDAFQFRDVPEADDTAGRGDALFQRGQQVGATGEDLGVAPFVAQQRGRFFQRFGRGVFERFHTATPPFCTAAMTRSGVNGNCGTRVPMALATALAMAAPGDMTGGSPSPMTPRSSYPFPVIMWTLSLPTSLMPASR